MSRANAKVKSKAQQTLSAKRQELVHAVSRAGRENSTASVLFHAVIGEKFGLSPSDEKTLDILMRHGPLTAGEISEQTGLATASVTGLIDRLEKKGFVRRVRDTVDRRRVIVEPNSARLDEVALLFGSFQESLEDLLTHYSEEQLEIIHDFLTRCTERLRQETVKLAHEMNQQTDEGI